MSVRLRLQRGGAKKRPFYRIVATDQRAPRDGRFIELLGTYDPLQDPAAIRLNKARVDYWLGTGASPSDTVKTIIARVNNGEGIDLSQANAEADALTARKQAREAAKQERIAALAKAAEEAAAAAAKAAEEAAAAKAAEEAAAAAEATEEAAEEA